MNHILPIYRDEAGTPGPGDIAGSDLQQPSGAPDLRHSRAARDSFGPCRNPVPSNVIGPPEHDARPQQATETTMKYMLLIYGNEAGMQKASKADIEQMMGAYGAYTEALQKAGVIVGGDRLGPSSAATTVRTQNGSAKVLDGPYADTKEQLGGYYIIDVKDLDAAVSWAARCPGASTGVMEVRPLGAM